MSHLPNFADALEYKYKLFLSEAEYLFSTQNDETGYGSWSGTNASLAPEKTFRFRDEYNTLKVSPLSSGSPTTFSISHSAKAVSQAFLGDSITFFCFVYTFNTCFVEIELINTNGQTALSDAQEVSPLTWTLVRGPILPVSQQTTAQGFYASVNFESTGGLNHVHIGHPVLTNHYGFTQNRLLRESLFRIPRFITETDAEQQNPDFPLLRFFEVPLAYGDRGARQAESFRYRDISEGFKEADPQTKSTLVNPDVCDPEYLPWLAQFVGVKLSTVVAGTTPWSALPATWQGIQEDIDVSANTQFTPSALSRSGNLVTATVGAHSVPAGAWIEVEGTSATSDDFDGGFQISSAGATTISWSQAGADESALTNGSITVLDTNWIELETFDPTDSNVVTGQRSLVRSARTGSMAGTKRAMIDAVSDILSGNKSVGFIIDPISDPWLIATQTLVSETSGGVLGQEDTAVLNLLNSVKPMGFVVTHECVSTL